MILLETKLCGGWSVAWEVWFSTLSTATQGAALLESPIRRCTLGWKNIEIPPPIAARNTPLQYTLLMQLCSTSLIFFKVMGDSNPKGYFDYSFWRPVKVIHCFSRLAARIAETFENPLHHLQSDTAASQKLIQEVQRWTEGLKMGNC